MKQIISILILWVSMGSAHAQTRQKYMERLDSIITNVEMGRPSKYVFHYDAEGRLMELIEYGKWEGKWTNPEQRLYTYDENGRVTTVTTKSLEEGRGVIPFRERAEYDAKGHLMSWVYEIYSKAKDVWSQSVHHSLRKYEYNALGNRTAIKTYNSGLNGLKESLEWNYAANVDVWDDDGTPKGVMFGHGLGIHFGFLSYREWVKEGIKEDAIMPYESYTIKPERIVDE